MMILMTAVSGGQAVVPMCFAASPFQAARFTQAPLSNKLQLSSQKTRASAWSAANPRRDYKLSP